MTQDYLKSIFDAFTRAENSTTNKVQGTGLGMAITKNIIELMGGTIEVFSEVDQGSLFRVELEFRIPEGQADKQFWTEKGISRILVADHDAETCKNIQMLMGDAGVETDVAAGMEELEALLQKNAAEGYHVVLLGRNMPDAYSQHTVERIREMTHDTLPVLFLMSHDEADREDVFRMENTGILWKPFFVSAFKEKILELQDETANGGKIKEGYDDNLEGMYFLAAEDNEINAEILREILSIENAGCEIVENGQLAVERFEKSAEDEFDAILMDVQMPVMNGYDATRAIRALDRKDAREIPIIAMTANAFAEDEKEALNAGMNVHLAKPIDVELLKQVIRQYAKKDDQKDH